MLGLPTVVKPASERSVTRRKWLFMLAWVGCKGLPLWFEMAGSSCHFGLDWLRGIVTVVWIGCVTVALTGWLGMSWERKVLVLRRVARVRK